jgi:hypothetical protein
MPERVVTILTTARRTSLYAIATDTRARRTSCTGKPRAKTPRSRFSQAADVILLWIPLAYVLDIKSFSPLSNGEGPACSSSLPHEGTLRSASSKLLRGRLREHHYLSGLHPSCFGGRA